MALLLHYTGQDYISRGLLNTELTPGSTSAIVGGCKTGKGFSFDNTANSRLLSETALEDDVIAISAWFKLNVDSVSGNRFSIFSTAIDTSLKLTLEIYDVNRLRLLTYTSDNVNVTYSTSNNAITSNIWYHVHALLDKTNRRIALFINGSLHGSTSIAGSLDIVSNNRWFIGYRVDNRPFNGQICNLKVYNHVLSQKEINEDYKSLMLHYKLDKPITTQVFDHSGFNRHIQVIENTTTNSTTEKRVYGGSLENNGANVCYGNCSLSDLHGIKEISISFWFRKLLAVTDVVFCNRSVLPGGIRIQTGVSNFLVDLGGRTDHVSIPLNTYQWYHVCISQNETSQLLYVDGVLKSTMPATTITTTSTITSLSHSNTNGGSLGTYLNGNVQDIRFYAKALTQAEVTELYQTRHMIDKSSNCYTYELIEGQSEVGMNKQGQLLCDEVIEGDDGVFQIVKSNKTIKTKEIKEI